MIHKHVSDQSLDVMPSLETNAGGGGGALIGSARYELIRLVVRDQYLPSLGNSKTVDGT